VSKDDALGQVNEAAALAQVETLRGWAAALRALESKPPHLARAFRAEIVAQMEGVADALEAISSPEG
jgi:hypothetical protein